MPLSISIQDFLKNSAATFDVRSPSEYTQGHLPGSYSLPLFTDDERALIGTLYKQHSHEAAVDLGLQIVGPKLYDLVQKTKPYIFNNEAKVLCWRGGMRSGFVARLLESLGYSISILQGGYKSFRHWVLRFLEEQIPSSRLIVLGGLTGSGKTKILNHLGRLGEQIIDLESLANHRGSAFGTLNMTNQPSQEQFENQLAMKWAPLDLTKPVWIEDESRMIGRCHLPTSLLTLMLQSPLFYMDIPQENRVVHLLEDYSHTPCEKLVEATQRIAKRLGSQLTTEIIHLFLQDQKAKAFVLLLSYYDKAYTHHLSQRERFHAVDRLSLSHEEWAHYFKNLNIEKIYEK